MDALKCLQTGTAAELDALAPRSLSPRREGTELATDPAKPPSPVQGSV